MEWLLRVQRFLYLTFLDKEVRGLWRYLRFRWLRFLVSAFLHLELVLMDLQWSQRDQCDFLSFMIKGMTVGVTIMHSFLIELQRSSKKDVACVHGKRNRDLLFHVLFTGFVQPFQPKRSREWLGLKSKFPNKIVTSNVSTAATINNQRTNFI